MPIHLPESTADLQATDALTPRQIVAELDRHVVGQKAAKRAVAVAMRNRIRRQRLAPEMAAEVTPKNILMIGPTGVGKTKIARRRARLSASPFLKVATDGVEVTFTDEAILSFEAGESAPRRTVRIDADEVRRRLAPVAADQDLSRYIL